MVSAPAMEISVSLFGALGAMARARTVSLHLSHGARLGDVLTALAERIGPKFLPAILRETGELKTHMRIYLNDEQVRDLDMELSSAEPAARIHMILMHAGQGG